MSFGLYIVVICIYGCLHPNYVLCVGFEDYREDLEHKVEIGAWICEDFGTSTKRTYEELRRWSFEDKGCQVHKGSEEYRNERSSKGRSCEVK